MFPQIPSEVDVAIIGMGPAGSSAAMVCAKAGLKVLGIEKRQEIGSPCRCGEGLSRSALERMGIELDKRWVNTGLYGQTVYAPNRKYVRIDFDEPKGWIVERKVFDKYLATLAARAGAMILSKTEALNLARENGRIKIKLNSENGTEEVRAKIVIAADGVESKIARKMGINTVLKLVDIASCAQFEMTNVEIDPKRAEYYTGNEIATAGYAWIFPKGKDTANVGIGIRKPFAKETAYEYLKRFVNSHPGLKNGSVVEVNCGGVPVGGLLEDMVLDNFMVVGDAAHQVNPIHGGGIAEAYVAGRIAAEVAVEAVREGDYSKEFLDDYNKRWWKERGDKLKKLVKVRQLVENLTDQDLNWLADYMTGEDLINLTRSSGIKKLAMLLMKKPRLLKFARKLL